MHHTKKSQSIYVLEFIAVLLIKQPPLRHVQSPVKHLRWRYPQKQCMTLKTEGIFAKSPTSDALVSSEHTSEHFSQKQFKTNNTSSKMSNQALNIPLNII